MWGVLPVLAAGTWSSDAQANSCAGWGQWTHMFGQEKMSISPPGRGEEIERPLSFRALDRQQMTPKARLFQRQHDTGGIGVLLHRHSVEGRVWHLL